MACLVPGCDKDESRRGLCGAHYKAWQRSGKQRIADFVEHVLARQADRADKSPAAQHEQRAGGAGVPTLDVDRYRREWDSLQFDGAEDVVARKRHVLAHLETVFFWVVACDRADIRRAEYLSWLEADEVFLCATIEAVEAAKQRAEHMMLAQGMDGKGNAKALIMWLNMYADWNPTSRTMDQMRNAKWLDECARVLREELQAEAAERVIGRLDDLAARARRLPGGAALRER